MALIRSSTPAFPTEVVSTEVVVRQSVRLGKVKLEDCRHCGKSFTPQPGKPGYIDECPECLYEKTALAIHKPDPRFIAFDRAVETFKRTCTKEGWSQEKIGALAEIFEGLAQKSLGQR